MSEQMTEEQAVEALLNAAREDGNDTSEEAKIAEIRSQGQEQAPVSADEAAPTEGTTEAPADDSFTGLDPASLPQEVRPYYDSMLADYRRKTQAVAEERRGYEALEEYGGVDVARQALDWVSSLQNPENALALHNELTDALVQQGYDVGTAQAVAAQHVDQAQRDEFEDEDYGASAKDPRVDELTERLARFEAFQAEQEQRQLSVAMAAEYDRQEAEIIRANPGYSDDDLEAIYNLSYATGGNLLKADQVYKGLESNILGRYLQNKSAVPDGLQGVPVHGHSEQPDKFTDLNDAKLDAAVRRFIAADSGSE